MNTNRRGATTLAIVCRVGGRFFHFSPFASIEVASKFACVLTPSFYYTISPFLLQFVFSPLQANHSRLKGKSSHFWSPSGFTQVPLDSRRDSDSELPAAIPLLVLASTSNSIKFRVCMRKFFIHYQLVVLVVLRNLVIGIFDLPLWR